MGAFPILSIAKLNLESLGLIIQRLFLLVQLGAQLAFHLAEVSQLLDKFFDLSARFRPARF